MTAETTTTPPLPVLHQARLDPAGLAALLGDIAACGSAAEVIPKFTANSHVPDSVSLTINDGHRLLLNGEARAVQFRYQYEAADWWDTGLSLPRQRHA